MLATRQYQDEALDRTRLACGTSRRVILQAETGSGKTVMATKMLESCYLKGRKALFIARGRELVRQASQHLDAWGVPHGIIMRGRGTTPASIQVASKDTFASWVLTRKVIPMPDAALVIKDECHESGRVWDKILSLYPNAIHIGLTATPARADGSGLGDKWESMVQAIPPSELIAQGWIVPTRVFAPYRPNLKGVKRDKLGDYVVSELADRMDRPTLVGDLVKHWKELGQDRPTICFTCNIAHCLHVRDQFVSAGIPFRHIDSRTTDYEEVEEVMDLFRNGQIKGIVNVGKLTQGVDLPIASCGILARPTRSYVLYRQMVGRLKRPFPGKTDCILLDHAGAVYNHGLPDEDVEWTLDPGVKMSKERIKKNKDGSPASDPVCCAKCHCMYKGPACPNCGHKPPHKSKKMETAPGKLVEVNGKAKNDQDWEAQKRTWNMCLGICANKRRSFGAAAHIFHSKMGKWPSPQLPHYPQTKADWQRQVRDVLPQFIR
jgi:DNA repair protein RadD